MRWSGNTGSGDRPDYTALGDTVNAAFRLETSTKQIGLDIAVGETTYKHLMDLEITSIDLFRNYTVNLKGYEVSTIAHACSFPDLETFLQMRSRS
jgi:adenylate cyclase